MLCLVELAGNPSSRTLGKSLQGGVLSEALHYKATQGECWGKLLASVLLVTTHCRSCVQEKLCGGNHTRTRKGSTFPLGRVSPISSANEV